MTLHPVSPGSMAGISYLQIMSYSYLISIGGFVVLCFLIIGAICNKLLRSNLPVKVNCWFCNKDHHVPYGNKNCWDCPFCEQYNGFKEDGDFNKAIPSQYDELLNHSFKSSDVKDKLCEIENGLCEVCNRNQLLKVKQLAAFVPQNNACFDEEVHEYQQYLDLIYKLCQECQIVLHKKLALQDSSLYPKLVLWKMEQKRKQMNNPKKFKLFETFKQIPLHARIFQLCSFGMASVFCIQHIAMLQKESHTQMFSFERVIPQKLSFLLTTTTGSNPELPLLGFFALIGAIFAAGKYRLKRIDAVSCFLWLFMLFSHLPLTSSLFPSPIDRLVFQGLSSIVIVCCTFACLFCDRSSSSFRRTWKDSRLSTSSGSLSEESCYSPSLSSDYCSLYNASKHCRTSSSGSVLYPSDTRRTTLLQDSHVTTTTNKMPTTTSCQSGQNLDFSLNNYLKAMKISTPKKPRSVSGIFTPRLYTPESVTLPSRIIDSQHSLISPARFKFKSNRQSWVAGGYWSSPNFDAFKTGVNAEQSNYSCPASPAGSISGDDRLSVFSEPARIGSPRPSWTSASHVGHKRLSSNRDATFDQYTNSSTASDSSICSRLSVKNNCEKSIYQNNRKQDGVVIQNPTWRTSSSFFQLCVILSIFFNVIFAIFIMYKV